jgi:Zn-dependent peptidase ImmA (M78 family)
MVKVNPNILRWARETAGLSLEEASHKLGITDLKTISATKRLFALEHGEIDPTRPILVRMAKQYHRPLIVFYMSNPPSKGNHGQDFRTLPREYSPTSDAVLDALIRDILARQSLLRDGLEDEEEAIKLPFVGSMKITNSVFEIIESITQTLNFDLSIFQKQLNTQDAFAYLRSRVEAIGIFVLLIGDLGSHHTDISLEVFRGFALADEIAPFIVINDQDSKAAWSFTLVHEIVHIWLGQTGVSNLFSERKIEQFCNDIASEFLLPVEELFELNLYNTIDLDETKNKISEFADKRNLSNSMVAYKLYRAGTIDQATWHYLRHVYQILWNESKSKRRIEAHEKKGGPNYYIVHRYQVGFSLISTVKRMMEGGTLTTTKAGKVLGVKPKNVQKLLETNGLTKTGRLP